MYYTIDIAGMKRDLKLFSVNDDLKIAAFKTQFLTTLDFESLEMLSEIWDTPNLTKDSTFWFDIHFLVFALVLVAAVLLVLNVIWKRRLMQGEKALLAGKAVSV